MKFNSLFIYFYYFKLIINYENFYNDHLVFIKIMKFISLFMYFYHFKLIINYENITIIKDFFLGDFYNL